MSLSATSGEIFNTVSRNIYGDGGNTGTITSGDPARHGLIIGQTVSLRSGAGENILNEGLIGSYGNVDINAGYDLFNRAGGIILAGYQNGSGTLTIRTGGAVVNDNGTLSASQTVRINASASGSGVGISNVGGSIIGTGGAELHTSGLLNNNSGTIRAGGRIGLQTNNHALTNQGGRIESSGDIYIESGTIDNRSGAISGGGHISLHSFAAGDDSFRNRDGRIFGSSVWLKSEGNLGTGGNAAITSTGNVHIEVAGYINMLNGGRIGSSTLNWVTAGDYLRMTGNSSITAGQQVVIGLGGNLLMDPSATIKAPQIQIEAANVSQTGADAATLESLLPPGTPIYNAQGQLITPNIQGQAANANPLAPNQNAQSAIGDGETGTGGTIQAQTTGMTDTDAIESGSGSNLTANQSQNSQQANGTSDTPTTSVLLGNFGNIDAATAARLTANHYVQLSTYGTGARGTAIEGGAGLTGQSYLLNALGISTADLLFMNDPASENEALRDAALTTIGRDLFIAAESYDDQKRQLYDNAIEFAQSHGLVLGEALTPEQEAALTEPILWYIWEDSGTAISASAACTPSDTTRCPRAASDTVVDPSSGRRLVARVYLPPEQWGSLASGGILGDQVTINTTGVVMTTTLLATQSASISAAFGFTNSGTLAGGFFDFTGTSSFTNTGTINTDALKFDLAGDFTNGEANASFSNTGSIDTGTLILTAENIFNNGFLGVGGSNNYLSAMQMTFGDLITDGLNFTARDQFVNNGIIQADDGKNIVVNAKEIVNSPTLTTVTTTTSMNQVLRDQLAAVEARIQNGQATPDDYRTMGQLRYELRRAEQANIYRQTTTIVDTHTEASGGVIEANGGGNIFLNATNTLTNSGIIRSDTGDITIQAGTIINKALTAQNSHSIVTQRYSQIVTNDSTSTTILLPDTGIISGNNVTLLATGDIKNIGGQIDASGNLTLATANGDIYNTAITSQDQPNQRTLLSQGSLNAGGNLLLSSGNNIVNTGSTMSAGGTTTLLAVNDITIDTALTQTHTETAIHKGIHIEDHLDNIASTITSGGNLTVAAGNNLTILGSSVSTDGNSALSAGNDVTIASALDQSIESDFRKKSGVLSSTKTTTTTNTVSNQASEITAGGTSTITSGGDMTIMGSNLSAGVGAVGLDVGGTLSLPAATTSTTTSTTKKSDMTVWQRMGDSGESHTTVVMNQINAPEGLEIIRAGGGVNVELRSAAPGAGVEASLAALTNEPGLSYLATLSNRPDTSFTTIDDIYDSWRHQSEGLTSVGAALIAIAVSVATAGAGSSLLGSMGYVGVGSTAAATTVGSTVVIGTGATATTATVISASTVAAVSAGISALASTSAISFVNNKGNLGDTLEDIASSDTLKNVALAAITAGMTQGIGEQLGYLKPGDAGKGLFTTQQGGSTSLNMMTQGNTGLTLGQQATKALVNAGVSSVADTLINGGNLGTNFLDSLQTQAVYAAGANVANAIGDMHVQHPTLSGDIASIIAHAALGCAVGAGTSGNCGAGAIGGAVGELAAETAFSAGLTLERSQQLGQLSAITAAALTGQDGSGVYTANGAAVNAIENNFISHAIALTVAGAYVTYVGDGDPRLGLTRIANGEDPVSQAMSTGEKALVTFSSENFPDATQAMLSVLVTAGQMINASITYFDNQTNQVVSRAWNELDQSTRDYIIGGGTVLSVAIPAGKLAERGVGAVATRTAAQEISTGGGMAIGGSTRTVPLGFANESEFLNITSQLQDVLTSNGITDATVGIRGSSVTGIRYSTGLPFDVGPTPSDFDFAIASSALLNQAQDLGIGLRSGGTRTGPLGNSDLEKLGLADIQQRISQEVGRDITIMLYESTDSLSSRGPAIIVPGK